MTLNQFWSYWTKHYAESHQVVSTQGTNENVYLRIGNILGHLKISKIKPRHILEFSKQLTSPTASVDQKPLSTAYIKKHMSVLRTMLDCACEWGFITENPVKKVKSPKGTKPKKKSISENHLASFFAALDSATTKHKLWITLAFALGLRREEIFGLQWRDIDFDEKKITIERVAVYVAKKGIFVKDAKTENSDRTIPLPETVIKLLKTWRAETIAENKKKAQATEGKVIPMHFLPSHDFIFRKKDSTVGHPHAFNTFISRFCHKAGLPLLSPHKLRHMYGSYLLAGGVNLATIASLMGHADKSFTLKTYIQELKSLEEHTANIIDSAMAGLKKNHM